MYIKFHIDIIRDRQINLMEPWGIINPRHQEPNAVN